MIRPRLVIGLYVVLMVLIGVVSYAPDSSHAQDTPPIMPQVVPDEYILNYAPGTPEYEVNALVAASGGTVITRIPELNAVVVRLTTESGFDRVSASDSVIVLEPNALRQPAITPNDPKRTQQWGLGKIQAYTAWDVTRGAGQIIAVLDTGVDMNHPDLQGHLLPGIDYVPAVTDFDPSPDPADPNHTHGTHVTGIANALTNNGVGIAGVAWDASTLPVRIIGPTGAAIDDEMLGVVYAVGHGATVINMSLGGAGWFQNERNAMNYAANYGVIVVASAGNDNSGVPFYPASYDHVISVANITSSETRSPSSNFGPYIDISAPGTNIHSTLYDNTYGDMSGTSMAAPHIAGVIALIQSAGRADTPAEVMEALLCTGKNLGTAGWDQYYGWGLVQANQAVLYTPGTNACLSTVANDSIDNAQPLTFHFSHTIDTTHATSWAGDPMPCAGDKNNTVWYRFDATRQGTLFLDTAGSSYDTVLAAYRKPASSLELAGCNNDADGGTTTSYLPIAVNVGDVLYVMVASNEKIVYDPLYPTRATPVGGTLKFKAELDYIPLAGCFGSEYSTSSIICISE